VKRATHGQFEDEVPFTDGSGVQGHAVLETRVDPLPPLGQLCGHPLEAVDSPVHHTGCDRVQLRAPDPGEAKIDRCPSIEAQRSLGRDGAPR